MEDPWSMTVRIFGEAEIDAGEVVRAASALLHPTEPHEIRGLPHAKCGLVTRDDAAGTEATVKRIADGAGTYYTLNPVRADLIGSAKVGDITRRWNVLIDCDPIKPESDSMATSAEKDRALSVMGRVLDWLSDQGWPSPIVIDSGNGAHLIYRVELPSNEHVRALFGRLLKALAARFDDGGAKIDTKVHNASRIAKLPGTWVRKGANTDERPWRMARLMFCPDEVRLVTLEQIEAVAGVQPDAPAPPPVDTWEMVATHGPDRIASYVKAAAERELADLALAPDGSRNNTLNEAAFSLGQFVGGGFAVKSDVESSLLECAIRCGLAERESRLTIASGLSAGISKPRVLPATVTAPGKADKQAATKIDTTKPLIVWANTIKPTTVEWLWEGRIPKSKLTTFAGVGGLGKTFILLDIAARISQGDEWPFSGGLCAERGRVLFISGEDDPDDTLVPRLIELGADLSRIAFLTTDALDRFQLSDVAAMDAMAAQIGPELSMVAIDPPTAYLGGVDDHKNSELRSLLSPLKSWASRHKAGLVFNTHVNKPQGAKVEAMMRVMGSVAWVNAVRAAHMIAKDPDDPTRRLFVGMKNNLGRERKGLAYRIVETETLARVEWSGEVDTTADEAISQEKKQTGKRVDDGIRILAPLFKQQAQWSRDELFAMAAKEGVKDGAVYDAKDALKIKGKWFGRVMMWMATPETAEKLRSWESG